MYMCVHTVYVMYTHICVGAGGGLCVRVLVGVYRVDRASVGVLER